METEHLGPNTLLFHSHYTDPGYTSFKIDRALRRSHWLLVLLLGITFSLLIAYQINRGTGPVDLDRQKQNPCTRVVDRLVRSKHCRLLGSSGHIRSTGGGEVYSRGADPWSDPPQLHCSNSPSRKHTHNSTQLHRDREDCIESRPTSSSSAYNKKQKSAKTQAGLHRDRKSKSRKQDPKGRIKTTSTSNPHRAAITEPGACNQHQKVTKIEIRKRYIWSHNGE